MALRYARYDAPRAPVRMKSFLLSVRHAARSGASINPPMCARAGGRETEPVPPALDDLAERADRDAFAIRRQERVSFEEARCRRRAATAQPDGDRYALGPRHFRSASAPVRQPRTSRRHDNAAAADRRTRGRAAARNVDGGSPRDSRRRATATTDWSGSVALPCRGTRSGRAAESISTARDAVMPDATGWRRAWRRAWFR